MKHSVENIACAIGLPSSLLPSPHSTITTVLTDSRSLSAPETTLFFALSTAANDGHRYIRELYGRGVRNFVVSHLIEETMLMPDANFIIVDDTLAALQHLGAANRRQHRSIDVVAIAGSRGKTTLKEWIFQALNHRLTPIARSPRSFNSQIGTALSLLTIDDSSRIALIEAGVSQKGEMSRLREIIDPTIGIFTNLHSNHWEGFSSEVDKCREKMSLFAGCKTIIYCVDNKIVADAASEVAASPESLRGWSLEGNDAYAHFEVKELSDGRATRLTATFPTLSTIIDVDMTLSKNDIENLCHLLTLLHTLGADASEIAQSVSSLDSVATRTDVVEGISGSTLTIDKYSMDLESLDMALDFIARRVNHSGRTSTLILGDLIHEHNLDDPDVYRRLSEIIVGRGVGRVIAAGEKLALHAAEWQNPARFDAVCYVSAEQLTEALPKLRFDNQTIVVKGSTRLNFTQIVEHLEARRHETVLDVNLDAIVHNFNFFKSLLKPSTGIVCMVKAFGYGAGSYELAKTLQSQGSAYLAVAVLDEGIELRRAGITMPIMVLNPRVVNYEEMFANELEPEIFNFEELEEIINQARRHGLRDYPIHLKFDTGMHRLGFLEEDLDKLIDILSSSNEVKPISMFSHLACADDPLMDDYTREQFSKFDRWCDKVQSHFPFHILRHILNSTGITRFPEQQHDMVRLGICLYGVATMADGSQKALRHVSSLRTSVISIKEWPQGTTIGYNRRGVCLHRTTRVATIPIGYADGIDRHLGNGAMKVWINGHRCPTIGNICMDACMIDITDCGDDCHIGDSVEIFGDHVDVAELSTTLDTIPYEILTSVSMRVKRVYYRE